MAALMALLLGVWGTFLSIAQDGLAAPAVAPTAAPSFAGCAIFPPDNIWNTRIDRLPVHARSAAWITSIGGATGLKADFGSGLWDGFPIGIPFTSVPGSQPVVSTSFYYAGQSDPGPYRIPPDAPIEGGSDHHVLVVDRDRCLLAELFDSRKLSDTAWEAGSGAIFNLSGHGLRPAGWTSADAAGLPILPGLARYDEVLAGEIAHALRFTASRTQQAYLWPARHYASTITDPNVPPMGARVRLKAGVDISGYSPPVRVILLALKRYGMFLADNGSNWYMSGAPDERWDNDMLRELRFIKGSDMEFVDESGLMVHPDSGQARQALPPTAPTATPTRTPTTTPTATATLPPTATPRPSCVPRPQAWTNVTRSAPDQYSVTFGAGVSSGAPNNRLRAVRFGTPTNATIRFNDQPAAAGSRLPFANGVEQATFLVIRSTPGATTVPAVLEDDCGDWPTFVGAGPLA